jgi:phosphotransferase system enzyme I (PtsP)
VLPLIDDFAREADFFSIGTNDFIQYMLAVDRTNDRVAQHFCPHHPAVLRGLNQIAEAAIAAGIDVSVCGEMAHDLRFLPFLLGIGIRQLSVDPHFLPDLQAAIGEMSVADAAGYAQRLLAQNTVAGGDALLCRSEDI